ncbi:MAG: acyl-CoA thioesterase [Clostridiales bacterium]|nr:acyl-CoA thioesterase [Clostridiales bacterium]
MSVFKYTHRVQYYETDRMKIVHHSNYVRWLEEARCAYLTSIGWGLERFESEGIVSPVTAIECRYLSTTTFPDEIEIDIVSVELKGARLYLNYEMRRSGEDKTVLTAKSEHCFMSGDGRIINLRRCYPEFWSLLSGGSAEPAMAEIK